MREIKFRYLLRTEGACGRYKEWFEYCTIEQVERWPEEEGLEILARDEWTGLTDKNGQDIYEDDLIGFREWGQYRVVRVVWDDGAAGFIAASQFGPVGTRLWRRGEVVGNVHENQESVQ